MDFQKNDYLIVNLGEGNFLVYLQDITINPVTTNGSYITGLKLCQPNSKGVFLETPEPVEYNLNEGYFSLFYRPEPYRIFLKQIP